MKYTLLLIIAVCLGCVAEPSTVTQNNNDQTTAEVVSGVRLGIGQADRLAQLPLACIQNQWPYKSGIVLSKASDQALPIEHHPAFYGCFDWHSAVHGHWSLVYLLKEFPELADREAIYTMLGENLSKENILREVEYFSLNDNTNTFERTYGWAWLLKLAEELYTWDDERAQDWYDNLRPLTTYIVEAYQAYLPKLLYPIRVGEHSNTAFGLSFAHDYAVTVGDLKFQDAIEAAARRFYYTDKACPITWEPSGYDFLSPCLQEVDVMRKVLDEADFKQWSRNFLPGLFDQSLSLVPARVADRSDGKLVHLDGLNYSIAWCLYSIADCNNCRQVADQHLEYSLSKIDDGDYAGQHWLASFALYAFKSQSQ